jgi:hypothetical protein
MFVIKKSIPEELQTFLVPYRNQLINEGAWEILI